MTQKNQTQNSPTRLTTGGFANMIALIIFLLTMGGAVLYFKNFPLEKLPAEQPQKEEVEKPTAVPAQVPAVSEQVEEVKKVTVVPAVANTAVTNQSLSQIKNKPF